MITTKGDALPDLSQLWAHYEPGIVEQAELFRHWQDFLNAWTMRRESAVMESVRLSTALSNCESWSAAVGAYWTWWNCCLQRTCADALEAQHCCLELSDAAQRAAMGLMATATEAMQRPGA